MNTEVVAIAFGPPYGLDLDINEAVERIARLKTDGHDITWKIMAGSDGVPALVISHPVEGRDEIRAAIYAAIREMEVQKAAPDEESRSAS